MKIKRILNSYATDGSIFKYLPLYGTATPQQMGIAYVLSHSGEKSATSLLEEYLDNQGHLTAEGMVIVSDIIKTMFKDAWDKKYAALIAEYNPLENYHMVEHGEDLDTMDYGQKQKSFVHGRQEENTTIGSQNNSNENEVSAFNSGSYQDNNKTTENLGQRSDSRESISYTDTETENANQDETLKEHDFERSGNIGVTTSQQMLESELKLRSYRFFEEMFKDIDSLIALRVYDEFDQVKINTVQVSDIDIQLTQLADGVRISVLKDGVVTEEATVYNGEDGVTPEFKLEDGNLYVRP